MAPCDAPSAALEGDDSESSSEASMPTTESTAIGVSADDQHAFAATANAPALSMRLASDAKLDK